MVEEKVCRRVTLEQVGVCSKGWVGLEQKQKREEAITFLIVDRGDDDDDFPRWLLCSVVGRLDVTPSHCYYM